MADFLPAYEKMIMDEGGYVLSNVEGDAGGLTYAGIARNMEPNWEGWALIDRKQQPSTEMVRRFYKANYWDMVKGDDLTVQEVAESIFNFAVNAGIGTASKLAQLTVGATPDGVIGPKTLEKLNACNGVEFKKSYALAKIARYAEICNRNRAQTKFLLGWINRTLGGLK